MNLCTDILTTLYQQSFPISSLHLLFIPTIPGTPLQSNRRNSRKFSIRVAGPITLDELPRDIRSFRTLSLFETKFMVYKVHTINVNYCPWLPTLTESFV